MDTTVAKKRKRGEPHPSGDGRVFLGRRSASKGGREEWVTPEQLEESRRKSREYAARRYVENPEASKEYSAQWRAANAEKLRERYTRYRAANAEKLKERYTRYRAANPERAKAANAKYYKENVEREKERGARYRAANAEKIGALNARRRAKKINATHPDHSTKIEAVLLQSAARLRKCLGIDFHLDHIVPLARGGMHHHANLRVLPGRLNIAKSDRLDSDLPSHLQPTMKTWSPFLN